MDKMKTLMLFQVIGGIPKPQFLELSGDYSKFNNIFINEYIDNSEGAELAYKLQQELTDLIYDESGNYKVQFMNTPTKDWDVFVVCGFIL